MIRQPENIPCALREQQRWSVIELSWNTVKQKYDKRPVSATTGYGAKSNDPSTWGTFAQAEALAGDENHAVAYALQADKTTADELAVIDIDHCITGDVISDPAQQIVNLFSGTYIERSVYSSTRTHAWSIA